MFNNGSNVQDGFGTELPSINDQRKTGSMDRRDVQMFQIFDWVVRGKRGVQIGLPGAGKTHAARETSGFARTSIFTGQRKNVSQLEEWENMIDGDRIPVAPDLCGVLNGTIDGSTAEAMRHAYTELEWTTRDVHEHFDFPCECEYMDKVEAIDPNGMTPLFGTDAQAHAPPYTKDRVVFMDDPDFSTFYEKFWHPYRKANTFLSGCDKINGDTVNEIFRNGTKEETIDFLENNLESRNYRGSVGDFHAKAPKMAYAILTGEEVNDNLYHANLPGQESATYENPSELSQDRESGAIIKLYEPPDLSDAAAVIGLDATPCKPEWVDLLGESVEFQRLLNADDRNEYLHERGYRFFHLNTYAWASQGGDLSLKKCEAYLREVYRKHGERPHLVTSIAICNKLQDAGLDHLWADECITYGKHRGTNDIGESRLLVVIGTPSRNDRWYQLKAGLRGETATPATDEEGDRLTGLDLDYQSPVANAYLRKIRRGETFQAMLRAGRDHDEETFIYVATGIIPEWLDTTVCGEEVSGRHYDTCPRASLRPEGEQDVIDTLRGVEGMSGSEFTNQTEFGDWTAGKYRRKFQQQGIIEKSGTGTGARYTDVGLDEINYAGNVDLTPTDKNNNSKAFPIGIPLNESIKRKPNGKYTSVISENDPRSVPKRLRCPDWIRSVRERVYRRRRKEQLVERARTADWEPVGNWKTALRSIQSLDKTSEQDHENHLHANDCEREAEPQLDTTGVLHLLHNHSHDPLSLLDNIRHCKRQSEESDETEDNGGQYDVRANPDNLSISERAEVAIEQARSGGGTTVDSRSEGSATVSDGEATRQTDDMGEQQESVPDTEDNQKSVTAGAVGATTKEEPESGEYPEEEVTEPEEFLLEIEAAPPEVAHRRVRERKRKQAASSKA